MLRGIARSLWMYYGHPMHMQRMARLYSQFIAPGDLAFDIGAHVGDRVDCFRRLGARVVAIEPQPLPARVIRLLFRGDDQVTVLQAACGDHEGTLELCVNTANPTVSSGSRAFIRAADGSRGWEGQVWDRLLSVPMTTLDALIARFGMPDFVKIDVEGFEQQVLAGLSRPLRTLSFEFTTIQRDAAVGCLERLARLGNYRFNLSLGEAASLNLDRCVSAGEMAAHIGALPHEANSGDIYAVLQD
jgi:FkbM family methyltransferase